MGSGDWRDFAKAKILPGDEETRAGGRGLGALVVAGAASVGGLWGLRCSFKPSRVGACAWIRPHWHVWRPGSTQKSPFFPSCASSRRHLPPSPPRLASARARLDPVASAWSVAVGRAGPAGWLSNAPHPGQRGPGSRPNSPPTGDRRVAPRERDPSVFFFPRRGVAVAEAPRARSGRVGSASDDGPTWRLRQPAPRCVPVASDELGGFRGCRSHRRTRRRNWQTGTGHRRSNSCPHTARSFHFIIPFPVAVAGWCGQERRRSGSALLAVATCQSPEGCVVIVIAVAAPRGSGQVPLPLGFFFFFFLFLNKFSVFENGKSSQLRRKKKIAPTAKQVSMG